MPGRARVVRSAPAAPSAAHPAQSPGPVVAPDRKRIGELGMAALLLVTIDNVTPVVEAGPKCTLDWCDRFCKAIGAHSGTCLPDNGCACAL